MSVEFSYQKQITVAESNIANWIDFVIDDYGYVPGEILVRFVSDDYLLELNRTSLGHDYYTDILTFNYVAEELINGDLFISVDRVSDNAVTNGVSFDQELSRVVIHGVLHLLGYEDSTEDDIVEMRAEEDYCLNILNND